MKKVKTVSLCVCSQTSDYIQQFLCTSEGSGVGKYEEHQKLMIVSHTVTLL